MNTIFPVLERERERAVRFMENEITHICRDLKKRSPGSAGEYEAGLYMAEQLKDDCGCENVTVERFAEHPGAFYGYLYFAVPLDLLTAFGFFLSPWLSIVFAVADLLLMLFQFILYRQVVDRFFPTAYGTNVTAILPSGEIPKQRIFLNGHLDAAWEWPVNYHLGGVAFETHTLTATLGVVYYLVLAVCALISRAPWTATAAKVGLLFVPFWVGMLFLWDRKRVVDGANDNLSGCYMGIALLKILRENGLRLKNTELGVILTGSEEAGLRGAKAWCEAHRTEYGDIPTCVLSFDTIHDPRYLMVNRRDLNGTLRADKGLADLFYEAAHELDIPCLNGWVPPMGGATDSAAFTQGGFRSLGITGLNHKLERYYHTRRDTWNQLDREGLENCFLVLGRVLEKIDDGQLADG